MCHGGGRSGQVRVVVDGHRGQVRVVVVVLAQTEDNGGSNAGLLSTVT